MLHICNITFLPGAFNQKKKNAKTGRCVELFHNGLHSARKMTENNGRKQDNEFQRRYSSGTQQKHNAVQEEKINAVEKKTTTVLNINHYSARHLFMTDAIFLPLSYQTSSPTLLLSTVPL